MFDTTLMETSHYMVNLGNEFASVKFTDQKILAIFSVFAISYFMTRVRIIWKPVH